MAKVFLCHATLDKPFVRKLARDLKQAGTEVWLDEAEIRVGQSLRLAIERGIETADFFVIVLSAAALTRPWVQRELSAAYALEASRGIDVIMPVLLEQTEIPLFLRDKKFADFTQSYEDGLEELRRAFLPPDSPTRERLANEDIQHTLRFVRLDGSIAYYSKEHTVRCVAGQISHYTEIVSGDGSVTDFRVQPGQIEKVWTETSLIHIKDRLPKVLCPGDSLRRKFTCVYRDCFPPGVQNFEAKTFTPTSRFALTIEFLKGRPPLWCEGYERRGGELIRRFDALEMVSRDGRISATLSDGALRLYSHLLIRWSW
jgi:hypothetical protein